MRSMLTQKTHASMPSSTHTPTQAPSGMPNASHEDAIHIKLVTPRTETTLSPPSSTPTRSPSSSLPARAPPFVLESAMRIKFVMPPAGAPMCRPLSPPDQTPLTIIGDEKSLARDEAKAIAKRLQDTRARLQTMQALGTNRRYIAR